MWNLRQENPWYVYKTVQEAKERTIWRAERYWYYKTDILHAHVEALIHMQKPFAKRTIEAELLADQGADANLTSQQLLDRIKKTHSNINKNRLEPHQVYRDVTVNSCLTCYSTVNFDVFLKIRHVSCLVLRNITWRVTKKEIKTAIIGCRVLGSLGYHNWKCFQRRETSLVTISM